MNTKRKNPAKEAIGKLSISELKVLKFAKAPGANRIEALTYTGVGYSVIFKTVEEAEKVFKQIVNRRKKK